MPLAVAIALASLPAAPGTAAVPTPHGSERVVSAPVGTDPAKDRSDNPQVSDDGGVVVYQTSNPQVLPEGAGTALVRETLFDPEVLATGDAWEGFTFSLSGDGSAVALVRRATTAASSPSCAR